MIKWATIDPSITLKRAKQCPINLGVRDAFGMTKHLPVQIYVDDALLMATAKTHMDLVLAALIKSIFVVMGEPNTTIRQCPLAMNKWLDLVVGPTLTMLGLTIDTS